MIIRKGIYDNEIPQMLCFTMQSGGISEDRCFLLKNYYNSLGRIRLERKNNARI